MSAAGPPADRPGARRRAAAMKADRERVLARWLGLAVLVAAAYWLVTVLAARGFGLGAGLVVMAATAAVLSYGSARAVPGKYLLPALLLTAGLQVWPIVFTAGISFTNYAPGRALSPAAAAEEIVTNSIRPLAGGDRYELSLAVAGGQSPADAALVMLLVDPAGRPLLAAPGRLTELADGVERGPSGRIVAAAGYDVLTVDQRAARQRDIAGLAVLTGEDAGIRAVSPDEAVDGAPTMRYDEARSVLTDRATGIMYRPLDGRFVAGDGSGVALQPEWLEGVGVNNFTQVFTQEPLRSAFLGAAAWNICFAALAGGGAFVIGAVLALVLHDPRLPGRRAYRALLLLPYAVPAAVAALTWRRFAGSDLLADPWGARLTIVLAAWWIGIPVMFWVCAQALRAISGEVVDAARLDGATGLTALTRLRLPMLSAAVGPLVIGMSALYFNQFALVYLVTGGGPFERAGTAPTGVPEVGATDLLITIAYRLAFDDPAPSYGFAAAVSTFALLLTALMLAAALSAIRLPDTEATR